MSSPGFSFAHESVSAQKSGAVVIHAPEQDEGDEGGLIPGVELAGRNCVYRSEDNEHRDNELEVTAITLYNTDWAVQNGSLIAANNKYICYTIRGGMIRVINQTSVIRVLIRGHTASVLDLSFFNNESDMLAR
jgi:hypothetical protein